KPGASAPGSPSAPWTSRRRPGYTARRTPARPRPAGRTPTMKQLSALATLVLVTPALASPPEPTPKQGRKAVARSLPLLGKGAAGYAEPRRRFPCHNQALPLLALTTARARGFEVSARDVERQVRHTAASLAKGRTGYRKGLGQGGQADTAGYALFALDVG